MKIIRIKHKIKVEIRISLTSREAEQIASCLTTLEGMIGAYDEDFTKKEANRAGSYARKIYNILMD